MNRQKRVARTALHVSRSQQGADICELFLAEMQLRRERLRELMQMVAIEIERHSQASRPRATRAKGHRAAA